SETDTTITITFSTGSDSTHFDTLNIGSIGVRANDGSILPDSGLITYKGGTANVNWAIGSPVEWLSQGPGSAYHFSFNQINSPKKLDTAFSITITAKDQFNHNATGFVSSCVLTTNN